MPGTVGAHFVSGETGCFNDIIGGRRGLIDALAIDGVSDSINERMDRILENCINRGEK